LSFFLHLVSHLKARDDLSLPTHDTVGPTSFVDTNNGGPSVIQRTGEALVLRAWPFQEADLLVSLFTREQGRIKGVARHAMRSRRRFGGALETMTHVRATYAERPRQELVRLDAFEILSSPLSQPIDYTRTAALQLVAEILEEALPEQAVDDAVFRLAVAVLDQVQIGRVWLPITYFALWMNRLMGWMPELGHCIVCGQSLDGKSAWYSPIADGITCSDDRRNGSIALSSAAIDDARHLFRTTVSELSQDEWPRKRLLLLQHFAVKTLERHLERRLVSIHALWRTTQIESGE
jgi:DNA repair protein RecO (recombination protein O)